MSTTGTHIAALYETTAAAHAARDALLAAGVAAASILVLDRGHAELPAESPNGLWGRLKHMLVPDDHAHPYAEGVSRGHPLVIADVTDVETEAAVTALRTAHPIDIEQRAAVWEGEGWSGVNGGQDFWLAGQAERDAAGSAGITGSGVLSGDYGAVGGLHGGARADTDITRGMRFAGASEDGALVNDDPAVRVYQVG